MALTPEQIAFYKGSPEDAPVEAIRELSPKVEPSVPVVVRNFESRAAGAEQKCYVLFDQKPLWLLQDV
jgi:hypothetical protein